MGGGVRGGGRLSRSAAISILESNARFLHDPKLSPEIGDRAKAVEESRRNFEQVIPRLVLQSEHDESTVISGRVSPDVRKIHVEADQRPAFAHAGRGEIPVRTPAEFLIENSCGIMSRRAEQRGHFDGQVLVQFEARETLLRGQRQNSLSGKLGGVPNGGLNGLAGE